MSEKEAEKTGVYFLALVFILALDIALGVIKAEEARQYYQEAIEKCRPVK